MPHACENCGVCCLDLPLPPFDANEEVVRAPEDLLRQVESYARGPRHRESNPCIWLDLDSGMCKHHDVRPAACRWFVPGSSACNELRQKAGLPPIPKAAEAQ